MTTIILDPGHGLGNKAKGVFDPGAMAGGVSEAGIVMEWANDLRAILISRGNKVVRTRAHQDDPAHISQRSVIAKEYGGKVMLSLHCNAFNGSASGTETFYRGEANKATAKAITGAVCRVLGTLNRGAKTESASQHSRLAVMAFQPCFLLEIGFIDSKFDRAKMLDPNLRFSACEAIADILETFT